jgi:L-threonylcarbamoyladenylate synthase
LVEIGTNINLAKDLLLRGELVAIPTETVYGLAANALNEKAVLSIFEVKNRPFFDPLIIHLASIESVKLYADFEDERLLILAKHFWPGPLTLLLPKKNNIPYLITSGLNKVAVRIPNHAISLKLLKSISFPLAAPSANPFGYVSPTEPNHVKKHFGNRLAYILDGGKCEVGIESSIVGIENDTVCIYRLGGLSIEAIEKIIGPVELKINQSSNPKTPGQLKNHYAPKKPLFVGDVKKLKQKHHLKKIDLIYFGQDEIKLDDYNNIYNLSETNDFKEAAVNLFKFLRLADDSHSEIIICSELPDIDLGRAINDRLKRAAT